MKLGIMQPYFFPYIGYWQLINAVDVYVIYDDVNYKKRGWINKNYISINGEAKAIAIRTLKVSQNKYINEIEVDLNDVYLNKLLKTIKEAYSKAPYFEEVYSMVENIILYKEVNLAKFLTNSILEICAFLKINTKIMASSDLKKNSQLKGQDKILEICKLCSANEYVNAAGGISLYSATDFQMHGIDLRFIKPTDITYTQKSNDEFLPNLSIIDIMMFNSVEKITDMLTEFKVFQNTTSLPHPIGGN